MVTLTQVFPSAYSGLTRNRITGEVIEEEPHA